MSGYASRTNLTGFPKTAVKACPALREAVFRPTNAAGEGNLFCGERLGKNGGKDLFR